MQALTLDAESKTAVLKTIPLPSPKHNEILVKIHSISLNPIDPLYTANPLGATGRTVGSDFAGTVISLGSSVPSTSTLKPGSRVAGFLQGACSVNERPGAFAEYLVAEWDLVWEIPENVSFEDAAGVSLVALTAAQGVWFRLGLAAPFWYNEENIWKDHPEWWANEGKERVPKLDSLNVFVYGASTAVGLYAAQMARLSGEASGKSIRLFGVASKARWPMLKAKPFEYDGLVDYHDEDWPEQVKKMAGEEAIHFAYDGISEQDSVAHVSHLLHPYGRMAIVRSKEAGAWKNNDVWTTPIYGAVWEGLGAEVQYQGFTVKKSETAQEFAVRFYKWLSKAVGGTLKPVPVRVMPGGLERVVQDGFALLGSGKVGERDQKREEEWMRPISAEKLVYRISADSDPVMWTCS